MGSRRIPLNLVCQRVAACPCPPTPPNSMAEQKDIQLDQEQQQQLAAEEEFSGSGGSPELRELACCMAAKHWAWLSQPTASARCHAYRHSRCTTLAQAAKQLPTLLCVQ